MWWMFLGSVASSQQPSEAMASFERAPVESMIRDQLGAFGRDDAKGAWQHVAPGLKQKFGSADRFLEVVRVAYGPVHRAQNVRFGEPAFYDGSPAQWLDLTGPDGKRYRALYLLEVQPDGTWMTSGCLLFEAEGLKST